MPILQTIVVFSRENTPGDPQWCPLRTNECSMPYQTVFHDFKKVPSILGTQWSRMDLDTASKRLSHRYYNGLKGACHVCCEGLVRNNCASLTLLLFPVFAAEDNRMFARLRSAALAQAL